MGRGFDSGHKRFGGRTKGTPNKKTQLLGEIFESFDFDVPSELIKVLPDLQPGERARILLDLMQYLYPKRKSVEMRDATSEPSLLDIIMEANGLENESEKKSRLKRSDFS